MRDYDTLLARTDPAYQAWLAQQSDDILVENDVVHLFSRQSVPERNETNEMESYLPDHLLIGDDSGDMVFVVEVNHASPVWRVDAGALQTECFEQIAPSFSEWLDSGFVLPEEPSYRLPLKADIYVNDVPDLKALFKLKSFLSCSWGASEMKDLLNRQPFLAVKAGHPCALEQKLKKQPLLRQFVWFKNEETLERISS